MSVMQDQATIAAGHNRNIGETLGISAFALKFKKGRNFSLALRFIDGVLNGL